MATHTHTNRVKFCNYPPYWFMPMGVVHMDIIVLVRENFVLSSMQGFDGFLYFSLLISRRSTKSMSLNCPQSRKNILNILIIDSLVWDGEEGIRDSSNHSRIWVRWARNFFFKNLIWEIDLRLHIFRAERAFGDYVSQILIFNIIYFKQRKLKAGTFSECIHFIISILEISFQVKCYLSILQKRSQDLGTWMVHSLFRLL